MKITRPEQGLTIAVGQQAPAVEQYAAQELQKYVQALYKFRPAIVTDGESAFTGPTVLLGNPSTNQEIAALAANLGWDSLVDDGFFLKTVSAKPEVIVVGGRLPRAALFGVYELVERWGVRFSLTEDILPDKPAPLSLGLLDEKRDPAYTIRAMRPTNNLPESSAAWGLADFQQFIDQMAKLKYNTFVLWIGESGPWLDYEFRGVKRPAGDIYYGWRYQIGPDSVGQELFKGETDFYNPVLAKAKNGDERKQLCIGLVRMVIDHCKERGLMSLLTFGFLEPPTLFKHKMNEWASLPLPDPENFPNAHFTETPAEEFGVNPKYAAWMNVKDPVVRELTATRVKALINTYPKADYYYLWVSEHRAGVVDYREIFKELDAKYHLSPAFDLDKELGNPRTYPYGLPRYQNQLKGDLLFLWLFDQLFDEDHLLQQTSKPDAQLALAGVMPELWPLVAKVLPPGTIFGDWLEYGTHATADRIDDIIPVLEAKVLTTLEIGIQDDNNMWFPQVNVESLERIVQATAPLALRGYVVPIWQIRQADINSAYLGEASWKPNLTANEFYHDYLIKLVGPAAAPDFEQAQRTLEKADRETKKSLYGYAFAFEGNMAGKIGGVDRKGIAVLRPQFETAKEQLRRAREKATAAGKPQVDFWLKRTDFAIKFLDLGVEAADLGELLGDTRKPGRALSAEQKDKALAATDQLLSHTRALIEIIVSDAKHIGDLGQIASMNRYLYQYLLDLRAELASRPVKD